VQRKKHNTVESLNLTVTLLKFLLKSKEQLEKARELTTIYYSNKAFSSGVMRVGFLVEMSKRHHLVVDLTSRFWFSLWCISTIRVDITPFEVSTKVLAMMVSPNFASPLY
jgi:hypothetical protein